MFSLYRYSQVFCTLCVGGGCDEGSGCNEVVMEVAMEVVMKEIEIKHYGYGYVYYIILVLHIIHYYVLYYYYLNML